GPPPLGPARPRRSRGPTACAGQGWDSGAGPQPLGIAVQLLSAFASSFLGRPPPGPGASPPLTVRTEQSYLTGTFLSPLLAVRARLLSLTARMMTGRNVPVRVLQRDGGPRTVRVTGLAPFLPCHASAARGRGQVKS